MKFLCGSCRTKYQISDDKVRGKILTIRCKKCGSKILVRESLARDAEGGAALAPVAGSEPDAAPVGSNGGAALAAAYEAGMARGPDGEADDMPTSIAPVPSDAGLAGFEWYLAIDGQQHGPFAFAELVEKVRQGEVVGRHYVWHDGMPDWTRVRDLPDLASYLEAPRAPPPPPADAAAGEVLEFPAPRPERDTEVDAEAVGAAAAAAAEPAAGEGAPEPEGTDAPSEGAAERGRDGAAIAASGTVPEGARPDLSLDLEDEDIFANVPRASAQELVQREPTKFFVAAAGVQNQKKRTRLGYYLAGAVAVLLLGFVGLWYAGVVRLSLPGIGNPFAANYETTAQVYEGAPDEDGNYEILLGMVATKPAEARKGKERGRRKRRASASGGRRRGRRGLEAETSPLSGLGRTEYVEDTTAPDREAGRARDRALGESIEIDAPGSKIEVPSGAGLARLPESDLSVPPPDVDALDASTIRQVVGSKTASVRICYEKSLKAREGLKGKLQVAMVVQPGGGVSKAWVKTQSFKGSVVGRCIVDSVRNWRFPKFEGEAQEIELPFVFERGG
jgi:predicted Zn finger-like uncharacterized protein